MTMLSSNGKILIKKAGVDYSKLELLFNRYTYQVSLLGLDLIGDSVDYNKMCQTPVIGLGDMNITKQNKFHWEYTINGFSNNGYSTGFGEFDSNSSTTRLLFSFLISNNSLRISRTINSVMTNIDLNVNYSIGTRVIVDIEMRNQIFFVTVKYGSTLVAEVSIPISETTLYNAAFNLGGLRFDESGYGLKGIIHLDSCYFIVNDELVWGVKKI